MEQKSLHIEDGSGDKDCFTVIPNYILNHSSALDQALYLQLKRLSGDGKKDYCYPSIKYLMKQLGVGKESLRKSFEYIINHKWVESLGKRQVRTKGGYQWVSAYRIKNIWQLNTEYYKGGSEQAPLEESKGGLKQPKGGSENDKGGSGYVAIQRTINKELLIKNSGFATQTVREEVSFDKKIYDGIMAKYQSLREISLQGSELLPPAQEVKTMLIDGRQPKDIIACMEWMAGDSYYKNKWTIKTVRLKLPDFVAGKLRKSAKAMVGKIGSEG